MVDLDANASTPLAPEALAAMLEVLETVHGNPSSIHSSGREARAVVDQSRESLADLFGSRPHELIFTSGGTESCNLGVIGVALAHTPRGRHIITCASEHHAVLHAAEQLEHYEGFSVTYLPVDREGKLDLAELESSIREDTTLVSVMHANNETGVIHPIAEIGQLCRSRGVFFHTDAVQSFGKLKVSPEELGVDALSIAGHKFYGPKGVGLLWLRAGIALRRTAHGGGHENSRRPGTENVAAIAGLAAAATLAEEVREREVCRLAPLRDELWKGIQRLRPNCRLNSPLSDGLSNTLNVSFPGLDGESLLIGLDIEGVGASSGSACMVGSLQPSHVLIAMGVPPAEAGAAVRFSFGRSSSDSSVSRCLEALEKVFARQK